MQEIFGTKNMRMKTDLLDYFSRSEPVSDLRNFDFNILTNLSTLDKDNESLNSCYTIASTADLGNIHIVFLTLFNWFRARTEATIKSRTVHLLHLILDHV
jgi:hypothetical protein